MEPAYIITVHILLVALALRLGKVLGLVAMCTGEWTLRDNCPPPSPPLRWVLFCLHKSLSTFIPSWSLKEPGTLTSEPPYTWTKGEGAMEPGQVSLLWLGWMSLTYFIRICPEAPSLLSPLVLMSLASSFRCCLSPAPPLKGFGKQISCDVWAQGPQVHKHTEVGTPRTFPVPPNSLFPSSYGAR
jgi:hypothetical protein